MWYLIKRGLSMLVILVVLSAALFGLLTMMPGNPVDLLITSNPQIKPEDVIRLKRLRGLDRPWYVQYYRWVFGYPEPARPPLIHRIDESRIEIRNGREIYLDLAPYLVDQNYVPKKEDLLGWLHDIWPNWHSNKRAHDIEVALAQADYPQLLLLIAEHDINLQNAIIKKTEARSAQELRVRGLFGTQAQGLALKKSLSHDQDPYIWFVATNSYGQEKVVRLTFANNMENPHPLTPMGTLVVQDLDKPFIVDLKKYMVDKSTAEPMAFSLDSSSPGTMSTDGVFTHQFKGGGQTLITGHVTSSQGLSYPFAFDVEHGVIGNMDKFNRGFLYVFLGDRNALGFSQTYKRPVYDLLFGAPALCGDGRLDAKESCDDGNTNAGDGCGPDCTRETDTIWVRAEDHVRGLFLSSGRIGNTVQLMLPALLLSLLIAIPLGIFSAYRQYSIFDYIINFLAFVGISLPVFWFGIMMVYLFAENIPIFPAGGVSTPGLADESLSVIIMDRLRHAVLPTIVLSIFYVGRWLRYMRSSMLEVLPKDYIRTARAKGLKERVVIMRHAFRNALIPVVTILALSIPTLFGGAVLTETVFSWPGVGRLQYEAVMNSDYYVAIVVFLVEAMLVMVGNLVADAVYVLVDPRMRK